eukprot:Hpha_TRINITY_DN15318_c3_g7::TRINITY_DN15318_c3_g7_i1::g.89813::m.89813/K03235/EF3, TEF3; elongation factor 3
MQDGMVCGKCADTEFNCGQCAWCHPGRVPRCAPWYNFDEYHYYLRCLEYSQKMRESRERRIDPQDGEAYTYQEFEDEYGEGRSCLERWQAAQPWSPPQPQSKAAAPTPRAPPPPAAQPPPHPHARGVLPQPKARPETRPETRPPAPEVKFMSANDVAIRAGMKVEVRRGDGRWSTAEITEVVRTSGDLRITVAGHDGPKPWTKRGLAPNYVRVPVTVTSTGKGAVPVNPVAQEVAEGKKGVPPAPSKGAQAGGKGSWAAPGPGVAQQPPTPPQHPELPLTPVAAPIRAPAAPAPAPVRAPPVAAPVPVRAPPVAVVSPPHQQKPPPLSPRPSSLPSLATPSYSDGSPSPPRGGAWPPVWTGAAPAPTPGSGGRRKPPPPPGEMEFRREIKRLLDASAQSRGVDDNVERLVSFILNLSFPLPESRPPRADTSRLRAGALDILFRLVRHQESDKARMCGFRVVSLICTTAGSCVAPFVPSILEDLLETASSGKRTKAKLAAQTAVFSVVKECAAVACSQIVSVVIPLVIGSRVSEQRQYGLEVIDAIGRAYSDGLKWFAPVLIDPISDCLHDTAPGVCQLAKEVLETISAMVTNPDLQEVREFWLKATADHAKVPECIDFLASTRFHSKVERLELALLAPILDKGLRMKDAAVVRRAARVVETLARLTANARDAEPMLDLLLNATKSAHEFTPDPECRSVCGVAKRALERLAELAEEGRPADEATIGDILRRCFGGCNKVVASGVPLCLYLVEHRVPPDAWSGTLHPVAIAAGISAEQEANAVRLLSEFLTLPPQSPLTPGVAAEELLCRCRFQLAYGARVLIPEARLELVRGRRYGLVGVNGSGKSTLLRAIAGRSIKEIPEGLRCELVEADVFAEEEDKLSCVQYLTKKRIADPLSVLSEMRFPPPDTPVGALSGGWRMKLALLAAMNQKCDVLMLDEPTNHLDPASKEWVRDFLKAPRPDLCIVIVSHDAELLQACTHMYEITDGRLVLHKGGLAAAGESCALLETKAEAYYHLGDHRYEYRVAEGKLGKVRDEANARSQETGRIGEEEVVVVIDFEVDGQGATWGKLANGGWSLIRAKDGVEHLVKVAEERPPSRQMEEGSLRFSFPTPRSIPGCTSRTKVLIRVDGVTYTYAGSERPAVRDATLRVTLSSRVVCKGPNGAGKSTLVKLLCGDIAPQEGKVKRMDGCRVAYVSQKVFDHLGKHLHMTPNEYIRWRYVLGHDKETHKPPDPELFTTGKWQFLDEDGALRTRMLTPEGLTGRSRLGGKEWELAFDNGEAGWVGRQRLQDAGWRGEVAKAEEKDRVADLGGVTSSRVEEHLAQMGVPPEMGTHTRVRMLSSGQRVKVALAACLWGAPHIVILDEPTNYIDRNSLHALAAATREFQGGVVVVTHDEQFAEQMCKEEWDVQAGRVTCTGQAAWIESVFKGAAQDEQEQPVKMTRRERLAYERRKKQALEEGLAWEEDVVE